MPVGLEEFYSSPDDDAAERATTIPKQRARLPRTQVDPYVSTINQLARAGLLTQRFADTAIVAQLRRSSFSTTGIVPRGTFDPGPSGLGEDALREFRGATRHRIATGGEVSSFIPREHTETSGFLRLLELFSVFNYAIAGGVNALVDLAQGEDANPLLEAWKGFTLAEKETFSDVFENMGWEGEDGKGHWARGLMGFTLDVLLDPLNLVTFGSAAVAARAGGLIGDVSQALRKGRVVFANGTRAKPLEVLAEISGKIADEAVEAQKLGGLDVPRQIGETASEARFRALAELAEVNDRMLRLEGGLTPAGRVLDEAETKLLEQHRVARLRGAIQQDVFQVFDRIAAEKNPAAIWKLREQAGGGPDGMRALLTLMGAGTKDADIEIATTVFSSLLAREGKDFTVDSLSDYLVGGKDFIKKLFDPGGLKLAVPFTDWETSIIEAQWMDALKFRMGLALQKSIGASAKWLTSDKMPRAIAATAKGLGATLTSIGQAASWATETTKELFGASLSRSPALRSAIKQYAANRARGSQRAVIMARDTITMPTASGKGRPVTELENDVLFDALAAEEDSALEWTMSGAKYFDEAKARDDLDRMRAAGRVVEADQLERQLGERLGYQERHLSSIILGDQRLAGHSVDEREELLAIARKVDATYRNLYDESVQDGIELAYMNYYLPAQYENIARVLGTDFRRGTLTGRITGEDPFTKLRKTPRSIATRKVSEGGLGLVPVKNVFGLLARRIESFEHARLERLFVSRIIDNLAIHPGQVEKLLGAMYGPVGGFGAGMLDSIKKKTIARDFWQERQILRAMPELQTLKDHVERGEWEAAQGWLDSNITQVNTALVSGEDSFVAALEQSVLRGGATIRVFTDTVGNDVLALTEQARDVIGRTPEEILAKVRAIKGSAGAGDLEFAAGLSAALEKRVRAKLGFTNEVSAAGYVVPSKMGAKQWMQAAKQSGEDAARLVILDEALASARSRLSAEATEVLEREFGKALDEWSETIVTMVRGRSTEGTVRWLGLDDELATLIARVLPAQAIEESIDRSGRLMVGEVVNAELHHQIAVYKALLKEGRGEEANELLAQVWSTIGKNPYLARHAAEWRQRRGLADLPFGEFTQEARRGVLEMIAAARETGKKHGLRFFGESPYLPSFGAPREAREEVLSIVRSRLRQVAGPDRELFSLLMSIVHTPGSFRSGMHWRPWQGIQGLMDTGYGTRASQFLAKLKEAATAARPDRVIETAREVKLKFDYLTRNIMQTPRVILDGEQQIIRAMTAKLERVVTEAAERAGAIPGDVAESVRGFSRALQEATQRRGYADVSMTEAHRQIREAFVQVGDDLKVLFRDTEAGEELHAMLDEFGNEIIDVNQRTSDLFRATDAIRDRMNVLHGSLRGVLANDQAAIADVLVQVDAIAEETRKMVASVEDRAASLLYPLDEVEGARADQVKLLRDDPVVGSFWRIADDLRGDMNRISREIDSAFRRHRLKLGAAHEKRAAEALQKSQAELEQLLGPMRALQDEARILDRLEERAALGPPAKASGAIVYREWLQWAAADDFLRRGGVTEEDWVAAVERVAAEGPADERLRAGWERVRAAIEHLPEAKEEVRRLMSASPLAPGDVAAYRAAHRLGIATPPPALAEVQQAAIDALEAHPQLAATLGLDQGFLAAVTARAQEKLRGPSSAYWIQSFADEAFLPSDEAAALTARLREEGAFLEALPEVARERMGVLSRIGATVRPDLTRDLRAALLRDGLGSPTSVEGLTGAADQAQAVAQQLVEQAAAGLPMPAGMEHLEPLAKEAARRIGQGEGVARELERYLADFEERVQAAYEVAAEGLGAAPPPSEALLEVARGSSAPALQRLTSAVNLTPEELSAFEGLLGQLGGDLRGAKNRRATYWLWRMGAGGKKPGPLRVSGETRDQLLGGIERYLAEGGYRAAHGARARDLRRNMVDLVETHQKAIETRRVAEKELELFRRIVMPDLREGASIGIQGTEKQVWRSLRQFRTYLRMQVLRAEHEGLAQVLSGLPSGAERRFLALRAEIATPASAEELEALARAGLGAAEPFRGPEFSLVERLGAVAWEGTGEQWSRVMSTTARRVLERTGVDPSVVAGGAEFLAKLEAAGIQGIQDGRIVGPLGFPPEAKASTFETVELNDAVNEILGLYLATERTSLAGAPALEGQIRMIGRHLANVTESLEEQGSILWALTGRARADQLSAVEAAHVIDWFGRKRSPEILAFGRRAEQLSREDLFLGRRARGWMPRSTLHEGEDLGAAQLLADVPEDLRTPHELEGRFFRRMEGVESPSGVDLGTRIFLPKFAWAAIDDAVLQDRTVVGPLAKMLRYVADPITNSFKVLQTIYFPAFHVRNVIDGVSRLMLAIGIKGMNMADNYRLFQAMRNPKGKRWVLGGESYDMEFLVDEYARLGGKTNFEEHIGITNIDIVSARDPRLSPWHQNFVFRGIKAAQDVIGNVAGGVDNTFRFRAWLEGVERGMTTTEAMRFAQKFMFDYAHGLTPFEREWMRRIFPFYTFSRMAIPLMLETMYKRPGLISALGKTHGLLRDEDRFEVETLLPSYIRDQWRINVDVKNGQLRVWHAQNIFAVEDLGFLGDLSRWRDSGLKKGFFKEVFGRLNPMARLPYELYAGKNLYFNRAIRENQALHEFIWRDPVISEWLQLRQVELPTGEAIWRVNGYRWHILQQSHIARLYRTLMQGAGILAEEGDDKWLAFLPLVTGFRLSKIDLDRRLNHLEAVSQFSASKLQKALAAGDFVQMRQVLDTVHRDEDRQKSVDESFEALRTLAVLGPGN